MICFMPLGYVTSYGYQSDPNGDTASLGTGKYKFPTGAYDNRLTTDSLAVSPDIEQKFKAAGLKLGDRVDLQMEDGQSISKVWADRTANDEQAKKLGLKPLRNRFDFYSPKGEHDLQSSKIMGFTAANGTVTSSETGDADTVNADPKQPSALDAPAEDYPVDPMVGQNTGLGGKQPVLAKAAQVLSKSLAATQAQQRAPDMLDHIIEQMLASKQQENLQRVASIYQTGQPAQAA